MLDHKLPQLILVCSCFLLAGCSREKVISGKVTDEQGNAIAGAEVRIEDTRFETQTGPNGKYQLDYVPGEIKLVVAKDGYGSQELALSIPEKRRYAAPEAQLQKEDDGMKQKQTVSDIRNVGTALFSWLTDQVGAAAAGQQMNEVDLGVYASISQAGLEELLVPQYLQSVPEEDGWGYEYDFYLNVENVLGRQVMAVRSPGRDGSFSADIYEVSGFSPEDYDEDIVWADGFFVRWPQQDR